MVLNIGANETLVATVTPPNATIKAVNWAIGNDAIATVDANGKVTGIAAGTTIITVTTLDGGYTATCVVSVNEEQVIYENVRDIACRENLPYVFGSQYLTESGVYVERFKTSTGADSIVTLNLTVDEHLQKLYEVVACESELPYRFGEYVFTKVQDTIYTFARRGCDGIYQLHLKITPEQSVSIEKVLCENELPYTFGTQSLTKAGVYTENFTTAQGGCDSLVTLTLEVLLSIEETIAAEICSSELPYSFNDINIAEAGIYTATLQAVNGCDSLLTLNLAIFDTPEKPVFTVEADTLTAPVVHQYNWFFNENQIATANEQKLIIDQSGNYSLQVVSKNGCASEMSEKIYVIYSSVEDEKIEITVYPNPVIDQLIIEGLPVTTHPEILLYNAVGQLILRKQSTNSVEKIDMSDKISGIYMLKITDNNVSRTVKIIKK